MAVVMTVFTSAFCTISAVLSMVVFGVMGGTILQIYGGFCLALALMGIAGVVFLRLQNSKSATAFKYGDVSEEQPG